MTTKVNVFTGDQFLAANARIEQMVMSLAGRKMEENDWTELYCGIVGAPQMEWSNLPFRDFVYQGVGIEFKMLCKSKPSTMLGKTIMHPSATRTISFDENAEPDVAMREVLTQWGHSIEQFRQRVAATSERGEADLRWGILLWSPDHSEFVYFEERLETPEPKNYFALWHKGLHRGKPTRNLHIFDKTTKQKRFSCTLPRNGAKLQPYFDVPQDAYVFRPEKQDIELVPVRAIDVRLLKEMFIGVGITDAISRLLSSSEDRQ